jgi:hypothetical protein
MCISPKVYQYIWLPATFLLLGRAPYNLLLLIDLEGPAFRFLNGVPVVIFIYLSEEYRITNPNLLIFPSA